MSFPPPFPSIGSRLEPLFTSCLSFFILPRKSFHVRKPHHPEKHLNGKEFNELHAFVYCKRSHCWVHLCTYPSPTLWPYDAVTPYLGPHPLRYAFNISQYIFRPRNKNAFWKIYAAETSSKLQNPLGSGTENIFA